MFPRSLMLALLFVLLVNCNGSPTSPDVSARPACRTTEVFARESFYAERAEAEAEFRGVLEFRDVPSTPNGRDHRYFLNGVPVYSGGVEIERAFKAAAGTEVTVRGKLVDFTHGREIWAA
ncbi:MAG TPA: hypothetical protein VHK90_10100, partial [Thermoanaerobaculia bacterium]|nr:hypothetical protein [Thermoanaerobaculia bacterium]